MTSIRTVHGCRRTAIDRGGRACAAADGLSLVEALLFGAIASFVLIAAVGLLTRGTRLLELSRRSSSAHGEARILLETLAKDLEQLVSLESPAGLESAAGPLDFAFVTETDGVGAPRSERVEYRLVGSANQARTRVCWRKSSSAASPGASGSDEPLCRSVRWLRLAPVVVRRRSAVAAGPLFDLLPANAPAAGLDGTSVAFVAVDLGVGEPTGTQQIDSSTTVALTTKLWCRNRLLELGRDGI